MVASRTHGRNGLVHPLCHRDAGDSGVDQSRWTPRRFCIRRIDHDRPASDWPAHAVWPEHGIPRSVLIDVDAVKGPLVGAAGPAIVPETIVIDHGKIYVSEHLTSVCQRMGVSIQPARLRTGRDKGPVERFFRTIRRGSAAGAAGI